MLEQRIHDFPINKDNIKKLTCRVQRLPYWEFLVRRAWAWSSRLRTFLRKWTFLRYHCGWWSHLPDTWTKNDKKRWESMRSCSCNLSIACACIVIQIVGRDTYVGDNTVETWSFVTESFLSCTESPEVFSSLGNNISTEFHDNASSSLAANGDIEEYLRIRPAIVRCIVLDWLKYRYLTCI